MGPVSDQRIRCPHEETVNIKSLVTIGPPAKRIIPMAFRWQADGDRSSREENMLISCQPVRMTNVNIKVALTDFSFGLYSIFSIIEMTFEYSIK